MSGISYGIVHRRSLQKDADLHKAKAAEHQRESWIAQAKKEYEKKTSGGSGSILEKLTGGGGGRAYTPCNLYFKLC